MGEKLEGCYHHRPTWSDLDADNKKRDRQVFYGKQPIARLRSEIFGPEKDTWKCHFHWYPPEVDRVAHNLEEALSVVKDVHAMVLAKGTAQYCHPEER